MDKAATPISPYQLKALATIGEKDGKTKLGLTGYHDGQAAQLLDNDTVRVVYKSDLMQTSTVAPRY